VPGAAATSSSAAPVASTDPRQGNAVSATPAAEPPREELRFAERLAHLRGKLVYQDGAPAPHLPIAIDNGCETLATFTDAKGRFAFDDVALPARFRSLERFQLWSGREADGLVDEIAIEPSAAAPGANGAAQRQLPSGATRQMAPITLEGPAITYLANDPGTPAAGHFMNTIDLLSMGPEHGSVIVRARPPQVEIARKIGFTVAVVEGNGNRYVSDAKRARSSNTWVGTLSDRVAAARADWELAELGASRKPRSRVRVDEGCVERASAGTPPHDGNEHQAP
jgi:hypothetical protein